MTNTTNNKPLETLRRGSLKIAIWVNATEKGKRYSTGGIVRSYKDDKDQWKETPTLANGELLQASRLLEIADDYIHEMRQADKDAAKI